ncbi:hypothetical protein VPH35_052677 [Triticum aestivum]|uniref:GRF-type domain-containing protein n=1 Tax=Triticum aestivum TaxID=4565 RepID=A0A077S2X4_WHEAT|nr:unnamed protein product [Triticum aestivum]
MPSWNDEETSSEEECEAVSMDMGLMEEPDTTVEPLFCGQLELAHPKCILHQLRPIKRVAFEGPVTGRRFYGCPVQENGVNCGVVEWVDGPWPTVLQRCLCKLWEMFHEQNIGRVQDKEKFEKELARLKSEHDRELAKLRNENDKLCIEYTKLVDDVSKMFDWQDGRVDQKQVQEEELEKKKKELEEKAMLEVQMEKLKLAKEKRCILQSQADIIKNTRKAMKDVQVDRDVLKKEKDKLELVVAELLKDGYGSKEKLEQIKAILESRTCCDMLVNDSTSRHPKETLQMDPDMGDVTEEEGEAVEVRTAAATHRRRRRRRQRALEAAQDEQQEEFNRRLSNKVLEKCNEEELELVFTGGRGRSFMEIIRWARMRAVMAPHPATRAKWVRFFERYD